MTTVAIRAFNMGGEETFLQDMCGDRPEGGVDSDSGADSAARDDGVGCAASERLQKTYIGFLELAEHIRD